MLEYIVRPFQAPANAGAVIIPSSPTSTTEQAVLTWGAKATMPTKTPVGVSIVCCQEQHNELSRKTEKVNITSSADPSNFITVERATSLAMNKKEDNKCGDDWDQFSGLGGLSQEFNDPSIGPKTEIPGQCKLAVNLNNSKTGGNTGASQGLSTQAPA